MDEVIATQPFYKGSNGCPCPACLKHIFFCQPAFPGSCPGFYSQAATTTPTTANKTPLSKQHLFKPISFNTFGSSLAPKTCKIKPLSQRIPFLKGSPFSKDSLSQRIPFLKGLLSLSQRFSLLQGPSLYQGCACTFLTTLHAFPSPERMPLPH